MTSTGVPRLEKDQRHRHVGLDPELPGCRPTQQWWVALLLGPYGLLASSATLAAFVSPPTKLPCRHSHANLNPYEKSSSYYSYTFALGALTSRGPRLQGRYHG
jgi:hypothetical protein